MKYDYFEVPTQVEFWDFFNKTCLGGIAYRDEIICGCCGNIFDISEIYESAPDTFEEDPIVVIDSWVDISHDIRGDSN
jgi:hypothetical protein